MKKFRESEAALSPVIGSMLMIGITVIVASVFAASAYMYGLPNRAPQAAIEVDEVKGGLRYDNPGVDFNENWIILSHKGGTPLHINSTKIQIRGYGEAQNITYGTPGFLSRGNIFIEYFNLDYSGKLPTGSYSSEYRGYEFHNPDLRDGYWSVGEKLILNGEDSINGSDYSTVKVHMANVAKTSNNWRLAGGRQISIKIIDIPSHQIIADISTVVEHV